MYFYGYAYVFGVDRIRQPNFEEKKIVLALAETADDLACTLTLSRNIVQKQPDIV